MGRINFILIGLTLTLLLGAEARAAGPPMTRTADPVQVPGELLKELRGAKLDDLRVFASRDGVFAPIVFQIDERLPDGAYVIEMGRTNNASQADGLLGAQDLLVFSVGDTGARVSKQAWPTPAGVQIEMIDPIDGGRSYCYLLQFKEGAPPAAVKDDPMTLAHWKVWEDPQAPLKIITPNYAIEGLTNKIGQRVYKSALNRVISIPTSAGGSGKNIIDGIRARVFVEVLFGEMRFDWDENSIIGGMERAHLGPVRGFGPQWLTLALPLGLEGPRVRFDLFTYDQMIVAPLTLNVPINPKHLITRAGIEFGYDFNQHARGMRFYSPNCLEGVTIDGKTSARERAMDDGWIDWFVVTGPQGSMIWRAHLDQSLMKQTGNHFYYTDDLEVSHPPDGEPGSMGYSRIGVDISSVEPGEYPFRFEWYFPPNFHRPDGLDQKTLQEYLNILDAPLIIKAGGQEAPNGALAPPSLSPKK